VHGGDQPGRGRDGEQAQGLVHLLAQGEQRALHAGRDFCCGVAFGSGWRQSGPGLGGGLLEGVIPGTFGLSELGAQGTVI